MSPLIALLVCAHLRAGNEVRLFTADGRPAPGYDSKVAALASGDTILLSDGTSYELLAVRGTESAHRIFAIGDGRVVRIAKNTGSLPYLRNFQEVHATLERYGLPIVEYHPRESVLGEAAVVEDMGAEHFTLEEFLDPARLKEKRGIELSPQEREAANEAFLELVRQSARFRSVGDQHDGQVLYHRDKGWKFADFTGGLSLASRVNDGTLFWPDAGQLITGAMAMREDPHYAFNNGTFRLSIPKGLHRRVSQIITERRTELGLTPPFSCRRALARLFRW